MRASEVIRKIVREYPAHIPDQEMFRKLERFDTQMKELGVIRETTYGLPLTDMFSRDTRTRTLFAEETIFAYNMFNQ